MTPNDCTCAKGLRCPDAERLHAERQRLREEYVRRGLASALIAWQQAEQEYQAHMAAAYMNQNNPNQIQGETP